ESAYHDCSICPPSCQIQDWNNQPEVQHCKLSGLPDLNQTAPWVANNLTQWINSLVNTYGFDGIRVDTVPEVNKPFWKSFNQAAGVYA
ncbi:amy3, partial [Symbiodinium sp. KB8]